jgi:hypothetical protein
MRGQKADKVSRDELYGAYGGLSRIQLSREKEGLGKRCEYRAVNMGFGCVIRFLKICFPNIPSHFALHSIIACIGRLLRSRPVMIT